MKTVEVNIYPFEELSQSAKERALHDFICHDQFDMSEARDSLKFFEETFPIKVKKWEFGYGGSFIDFEFLGEDEIEELTGWRLATYIWNNYRDDIYEKKCYSRMRWEGNKCILKQHRSKIIIQSQMCPFTGVCYDEDLLDPMWKFLKAPNDSITFKELLNDCLHSWLESVENEDEYRQSEESFQNTCEANEWLFTKEGRRWD